MIHAEGPNSNKQIAAIKADTTTIRTGVLAKKEPITVFISDDGRDTDYTILRPMFESENVPCCSAIIVDPVGSGYGDVGFMTDTQILDLQNRLGWEIMSHSISHTNPWITSMSDADAEAQYRDSRSMLQARGFNVESYVTPGNVFNTRERIYAKRHYRAARVSEFGADGFNRSPIETHELKTVWLDPEVHIPMKDFNYYKGFIDQASAENLFLIISTHSSLISTPELQALFLQVIQYAKAHTQVMTLRDALDRVGNVVEIGDFSKLSTGVRAPSGSHTFIGFDGAIDDGRKAQQFTVGELNQYTPATAYDSFLDGETVCAVDSATATSTSAPENSAGIIKMNKVTKIGQSIGYNYQTYHIFGSGKVYHRSVTTGPAYSAWKLLFDPAVPSIVRNPVLNTYTPATTYSTFADSITYCAVDGATASSTSAPEGAAGSLITYKINPGGSTVGYNFQEYHIFGTSKVYQRRAVAGPAWGTWELIYPYTPPAPTHFVAAHNAYDCTTVPSSFPTGTITSVTTTNTTGSPTATAGTLIMHNTYATIGGFTFQEFHVWGSTAVYKRYCTDTTTYSAWTKISV